MSAVTDLARAGNFPSVWSNVLAALLLSGGVQGWPLALAGGTLLYAGGATYNDVCDTGFDSEYQRFRPIPSGKITRSAAAWIGAAELIAGLGCFRFSLASVGLVACILAYDVIHKRVGASVFLMAGCRALLALAIATLPGHHVTPIFAFWVTALYLYITVLSVLSRQGKPVRHLLAFIPLVDAAALLGIAYFIPAVCCALAVPLGKVAQRVAAST